MQKNNCPIIFCFAAALILFSPVVLAEDPEDYKILREIVVNEFKKEAPVEQGDNLSGVLRIFKTSEKKVSIILGACFDQGAEVDAGLFKTLYEKQVPVSLFVDQGWLRKNPAEVKQIILSKNVTLENHGLNCRALSVAGKSVKGQSQTAGVDEAFEEIERNAREIEQLSGRLPRFYKAGYDAYDNVALKIVSVLGYIAVQGDLKLRSRDVESEASLKNFLDKVKPGSIILIPANRAVAVGVSKLLAGLTQNGYQIVSLDDVVNAEESL